MDALQLNLSRRSRRPTVIPGGPADVSVLCLGRFRIIETISGYTSNDSTCDSACNGGYDSHSEEGAAIQPFSHLLDARPHQLWV